MAIAQKQAMGVDELDAVAERGYFKGEEVLACDEAGIAAYVPRTTSSTYVSSHRAMSSTTLHEICYRFLRSRRARDT
jgi:hypothetical protein